jgi:hypothetical protein
MGECSRMSLEDQAHQRKGHALKTSMETREKRAGLGVGGRRCTDRHFEFHPCLPQIGVGTDQVALFSRGRARGGPL